MRPRKNRITRAIMKSCTTKEKLYKLWKKGPYNNRKREEYKNFTNILKNIINKAKDLYDKKQIEASMNSPKRTWMVINQKIGKNRKRNNNIYYLTDSNKKISDPVKIAEHLNKFFCSIGKKLIKLPTMNSKSICFEPTNHQEISKVICRMESQNGGIDNINGKTLKTLVKHITEQPLGHIFNNCIEKAIWPDELKMAEVIPIHKSKEKNIATNYRPISRISNLAKIFKKIIYNRITNFINKCEILAKNQYGFRKNKSTKDALSLITNATYDKLDKSTPIAITFLHLAKAFDAVNHQILLHKLYNYGIRGRAYNLIKVYLGNRLQKVKLNNINSQFQSVNMGVPQGTILGPLLFLLYINDLLRDIPKDTIASYADDTAVITTAKTWKEVETKMHETLYKILTWLALNKLSLNTNKTVYMEFGNQVDSTPKNLDISIQSNQ